MRKYIRNFKFLNRDLKVLLCIAVVSILLVELVFNKIPEVFPSANVIAKIYIALCYSYISATIFYFLVVHNPKQNEKEKFYEIIESKLNSIVFDHTRIYNQISRENDVDTFDYLNKQDLRNKLKSIDPYSLFGGIRYISEGKITWLRHIFIVSENNKREIDNLFLNSNLIEVELVVILKKFLENSLFPTVKLFSSVRIKNETFEDFCDHFYNYTEQINEIKKYLDSEIRKYQTNKDNLK